MVTGEIKNKIDALWDVWLGWIKRKIIRGY